MLAMHKGKKQLQFLVETAKNSNIALALSKTTSKDKKWQIISKRVREGTRGKIMDKTSKIGSKAACQNVDIKDEVRALLLSERTMKILHKDKYIEVVKQD